jgi:opacity protein-like surface antigen
MVLIFAAMAIAVSALSVPVAEAQGFTTVRPGGRGGHWDFILPIIFSDSTTINGQGGSTVEVNADWSSGFGFAYNITDRFQIGGLFTGSYRSYDATIVLDNGLTRRYSNYLDSTTLSLNGTYHLLDGAVTPFVTGGIGFTYVDTNVANGPSTGSCYYDPWWGYVCNTYTPTRTENDLSYNAGIGVRFDVSRQFGMQVGYYKTWIDFSRASGTPDFDSFKFDLLFRK